MEKEQILQLKQLRNKYPYIDKILIAYCGEGDDFDSFYGLDFVFNSPAVGLDKPTELELSDIFECILDNEDISFNDDGSNGEIILDLENEKVIHSNYCVIISSEHNFTNEINFENLNED